MLFTMMRLIKLRERDSPFEQGDITSDADDNTWDVGYYDVSALIPENVKEGIAFGRGDTGTLIGADAYSIKASSVVYVTNDFYNDRTLGDSVFAEEFGAGWT